MIVIHFFELWDFARELEPGQVVRVESTMRAVPVGKLGSFHDAIAEVHARGIIYGSIHVFTLRIGEVRMAGDEPFGPDPEALRKLKDRQANAEAALIDQLGNWGADVRRGLIDIGEAKAVRGQWADLPKILGETEGGNSGQAE